MRFIISRTSVCGGKPCEEAQHYTDQDRGKWGIEINSLAELLAFQHKYGDIIISSYQDNTHEIEIYDDYRE